MPLSPGHGSGARVMLFLKQLASGRWGYESPRRQVQDMIDHITGGGEPGGDSLRKLPGRCPAVQVLLVPVSQ